VLVLVLVWSIRWNPAKWQGSRFTTTRWMHEAGDRYPEFRIAA